MVFCALFGYIDYAAILSPFFLRKIRTDISAPTAAEPTQDRAIVPVPTTEPVALFSASLAAAFDELSAAERSAADELSVVEDVGLTLFESSAFTVEPKM